MSDQAAILEKVKAASQQLYQDVPHDLPFHGWSHVDFVHKHALRFATELNADPFLVALAAYTHDLNYISKVNSSVESGGDLRNRIFADAQVDPNVTIALEQIIYDADIANRGKDISSEAKALSDADTLFKALPITPILLARLFLEEQEMTLQKLSASIVKVQKPLMDENIYFYSKAAEKYLPWAKTNLDLWKNMTEYFNDHDASFDVSDIQQIKSLL